MKYWRQHTGSSTSRVPAERVQQWLRAAMRTVTYGIQDVAGALADVAFVMRRGLRRWRARR